MVFQAVSMTDEQLFFFFFQLQLDGIAFAACPANLPGGVEEGDFSVIRPPERPYITQIGSKLFRRR